MYWSCLSGWGSIKIHLQSYHGCIGINIFWAAANRDCSESYWGEFWGITFSLTRQDPFSISSFSDIIATEPCCSLIGIQLPNEPGSSTLQLRIPVNNTLQYHAAKNTRQRDDHHSQWQLHPFPRNTHTSKIILSKDSHCSRLGVCLSI